MGAWLLLPGLLTCCLEHQDGGSTTMSMISWVTGSTPRGKEVGRSQEPLLCQVATDRQILPLWGTGVPGPTAAITQLPRLQAARRPESCAPPLLLPGSLGLWLIASARGPGLQASTPLFHFLYVSSPFTYSLASWCVGQRYLSWSYVCFAGYRLKERDKEIIFLCHNAEVIPNIIFYI